MSGRERQDPDEQFAGDEHLFDLAVSARALQGEEQQARHGHRQIALFQDDGVTVVLFAFEAGGRLERHSADGLVMIHVTAGTIDVATPTASHSMAAGSLLILAAGVQHNVTAHEASQMVLTVHLRHG